MPAVLIKDFPSALHRKLKAAARRERRSMTQQALILLEHGLRERLETSVLPAPFRGRFPLDNRFIDRAKHSGRA